VITKRELALRRAEWILDQRVIEKDYVLGWLLAGDRTTRGAAPDVGVQGRDMPSQVLLRDVPILLADERLMEQADARGISSLKDPIRTRISAASTSTPDTPGPARNSRASSQAEDGHGAARRIHDAPRTCSCRGRRP